MSEQSEPRPRWKTPAFWVVAALVALPVGCGIRAATAPGASEIDACKKAARAAFPFPDSTENVTFSEQQEDDWFVKGTVTVWRDGAKVPVRYWECSGGKITWSSTS